MTIHQFSNCACCKKYLNDNKHISLHLAWNKQIECGSALSLIDNKYASSQWSKCCGLTRRSQVSPQHWVQCDDAYLLSIRVQTMLNHLRFVFYHNINAIENVFLLRAWPRSWHKKRASVVYNFLALWLVYSPKWALIGYHNHDKTLPQEIWIEWNDHSSRKYNFNSYYL